LTVLHGPALRAANPVAIDVVAILAAVGLRAVVTGSTAAAIGAIIVTGWRCVLVIAASAAGDRLCLAAGMEERDHAHPSVTDAAIGVISVRLRTGDIKRCA